jgi:hypothetical protein
MSQTIVSQEWKPKDPTSLGFEDKKVLEEMVKRGISPLREKGCLWPSEFAEDSFKSVYSFVMRCATRNEANKRDDQPIPKKEYIKRYVMLWWICRKRGRTLITEKCRRMVISWVARACELWAMGRERSDQLLANQDLESASKHVWRLEYLYQSLQRRFPGWRLPPNTHSQYEGDQMLKAFALPNGSKCRYANGNGQKLQGDGTSLITMEEPSTYRYLPKMLAQAKIICLGQTAMDGEEEQVGGFVNLITNSSFSVAWQKTKAGPKGCELELRPYGLGMWIADLPSGALYLKIEYYADPARGTAWLESIRQEMIDTPADFELQILMNDKHVQGALWTRDVINKYRLERPCDVLGEDGRVLIKEEDHTTWRLVRRAVKRVIAIDPSISDPEKRKDPNKEPDDCGIIIASLVEWPEDGELHMLVEEDISGVKAPWQWADDVQYAADICHLRDTPIDECVYEANQGGELVKETLEAHDVTLPIRSVHASIGKGPRAHPLSVLYKQGRVHHIGDFDTLETHMTTWDPLNPGSLSPGDLDALVWAAHKLGLCKMMTMREYRRSGLVRGAA